MVPLAQKKNGQADTSKAYQPPQTRSGAVGDAAMLSLLAGCVCDGEEDPSQRIHKPVEPHPLAASDFEDAMELRVPKGPPPSKVQNVQTYSSSPDQPLLGVPIREGTLWHLSAQADQRDAIADLDPQIHNGVSLAEDSLTQSGTSFVLFWICLLRFSNSNAPDGFDLLNSMALTVVPSGVVPRSLPPPLPRDSHELKAVLAAQDVEAKALKAQLADVQRESHRLKHKLRDVESELHVASEATTSATQRLTAHAERQELLLSAGVERGGVERVKLEEELQHMERLLWERDQDIRRLRHRAQELESHQLHLDVEMRGLHAAKENSTSEAHKLSGDIAELLHKKLQKVEKGHEAVTESGVADSLGLVSTLSQREAKRLQETTKLLETKRQEHANFQRRADQVAAEARRLEAEEASLQHRVHLFEKELRQKQGQMEQHDKQAVHDGGLLREHIEELRHAVAKEQKGFMAADHCAALKTHVSEETRAAKQEVQSILKMIPELDAALRARKQHVYSAEVSSDSVDVALHAVLRAGTMTPPGLVCRLGHAKKRVVLCEGQLTVVRQAGSEVRHCILSKDAFEYYAIDGHPLGKPLARFPMISSSCMEWIPSGLKLRHGARVITLRASDDTIAEWRKALQHALSLLQLRVFSFQEQLCHVLAETSWRAVIKSICGVLPSEQRLVYKMDLLEDPALLTEAGRLHDIAMVR
eukprot:s621_g29.t3